VAHDPPQNLVDWPSAVFAAGVPALATLLLPKEVRPTHQTTVAGASTVTMRSFSWLLAVEKVLASDCLAVLAVLDS
jgi:hypothetical protein